MGILEQLERTHGGDATPVSAPFLLQEILQLITKLLSYVTKRKTGTHYITKYFNSTKLTKHSLQAYKNN